MIARPLQQSKAYENQSTLVKIMAISSKFEEIANLFFIDSFQILIFVNIMRFHCHNLCILLGNILKFYIYISFLLYLI